MILTKYILYILLIITAMMSIQTAGLRKSVIYVGTFSLISSFVYLLLYAPDVAIAEAIIGCTISVILLLTALKRYRVFTIYYVGDDTNDTVKQEFLQRFHRYLTHNEFDPHLIHTSLDDELLHDTDEFDVLIVDGDTQMSIYSSASSYHSPLIKGFLNEGDTVVDVEYYSLSAEEDEYEV